MSKASIVIPTYDEPETAPRTIGGLLLWIDRDDVALDGEIIVVDDTPDVWTAAAIDRDHGNDDRVRVCRRDDSGLASAVLHGIDAATHETIVVMDADGQHPVAAVPALVDAIASGADLAVGSRFTTDGEIADDWPAHRHLLTYGAATVAQTAVPAARQLTDPLAGFFAVDCAVVEPVRHRLRPTGYKILLELLARCPVREVHEVGIRFGARRDGESTLGLGEAAAFARHCARLARPARRPTIDVRRPTETL